MADKVTGPKSRPKFKAADQSTAALKALLNKGSGASRADVNKAIAELKKRGEDTPPASNVSGGRREKGNDVLMNKGGDAKKVPVISIGVGMAEVKKGKKPEMAYGGMSGGKKHMYAAGGSVTDNPGLRALKKASPEAYNKITGK
jgi:hypothetical protein